MSDPETGLLLTVPSYSPENSFLYEGERCSMTAGAAFDTAVAKRSFQIVRCAARILGREDSFTDSLKGILEKLPPIQVGSRGQLLEWFSEYEEAYPDHRHTSHLLALHPFNLIDPAKDRKLAEAAETSLALRLGENAQDIVYANWAGALLVYGGHEVCAEWDEKGVSGSVLAAGSGELRVACMGQECVFQAKKGERCRFWFERRKTAPGL